MLHLDGSIDERLPVGHGGLFYGVHPALVTDVKDPDGQGRVRVKLPWSPDSGGAAYEAWARVATLMAGADRGTWFVPDVDDEVLVAFEGGNASRPYVLGSLWNGRDQPPDSMDGAGRNPHRIIKTRNGVKVTLDDEQGQEKLILETPGGQKVTLRDGPGSITVEDANGNRAVMESSGVTITTSAKATISASTMEITAGSVTVNAGMSKFSGVVQADTVITNAVVSSSYTPGAGNVW
jgi:uncharacterized protein involved in type VI secretion and phage assembly